MQYVTLGRSGLSVSRVCLGMMTYGSPSWRPWVLDEDHAPPFVRRALEAGINFFDTADMYSNGRSEEILGRTLREFATRDQVVVATKVFFPMGDGPNDRGLSRKHILQGIDASLKRLQMDYVDLYQIHRFDPETPLEETLEALDSVVRAGKARYIGASSMYAWQLMKALALQDRNGWHRFVSLQNHYNLCYREGGTSQLSDTSLLVCSKSTGRPQHCHTTLRERRRDHIPIDWHRASPLEDPYSQTTRRRHHRAAGHRRSCSPRRVRYMPSPRTRSRKNCYKTPPQPPCIRGPVR